MKTILTTLLMGLYLIASAQTTVESMQTTNNDETLAMNIVGKRNGSSFRHNLHFDVKGMSKIQRDSLYEQTLQALSILGVKDVPGLKRSLIVSDTASKTQSENVTFQCETCTHKGRLEVYGGNFTATRIIDGRPDQNHSFPMRMRFVPGDYRLLYYQKHGLKHVLQIQSTFTVRAGEENTVKVK